MDADLLKGTLRIKGYSISEIVKEMNNHGTKISVSAFYKKMRSETEFTANEISSITKIAKLDKGEVFEIFFKELVSKKTLEE